MSESLGVQVSSLELSLEILVDLESLSHLFVHQLVVGDGERDKELSSVCLSLELRQSRDDPEKDVVDGPLVSMHNVSLEVGAEVRRVTENFEEVADSLLGFVLSFLLNID